MRVVVTGAARGIGSAVQARFERDGHEVFGLDLGGVVDHHCDVTDAVRVAEVADAIGSVDVLVNNAGLWIQKSVEDSSLEDLERVLDVNLLGPVNCARSFGAEMIRRGRGGAIINVASIAAVHPSPSGLYSSSKAGLVAFTRQIAVQWGRYGIRSNAVAPGLIITEGTRSDHDDAGAAAARAAAVPLGRLGAPEEIATVVAFLASPEAAYVNGAVINVDGGLSHTLLAQLGWSHVRDGGSDA